jgi:hypothetical protein
VRRLTKFSGTHSYPIDAWVDGAGMIARLRLKMSTKLPQTTRRLKMDIQEDFYDFGVHVKVSRPPSDEVYDATNATSQAVRSSGLGG